jgi:hypothetical protein
MRNERQLTRLLPILLLSLILPARGLLAQSGQGGVPRFEEVSGHGFGERVTVHAEMVRYLERLAATSDRVALIRQGRSWEERELVAAVITAPENHARLDAIREASARLSDPRKAGPGELDEIIASQPVIVWFGGSIHGNELSGSEGLLKLLEHLTTSNSPSVRQALEQAVIIIDPMLNPNPAREDWGHDFTGWEGVGFRTGHYYFDTNRDWFAHTQRETRARVPTMLAWNPQVSVDAHEMGPGTEFYFDPAAEPYGPYFPAHAREWFTEFGQAYAAAFDSAGFEYKTREQYNYFYPGYTTSYSSYQGSVGMLYEQGSPRGLAGLRPDESVRTLAEALEHQFVAAWTAVRAAVNRREEILRGYFRARQTEIAEGGTGTRRYFIPAEGDPGLVTELVDLLLRNGIEVGRLSQDARVQELRDRANRSVEPRSFAAGTYVVEAAQPHNRLLRALLAPDLPLPETFLAEARARLERDENPRFYDITAWSLPLLFDLHVYGSSAGDGPPAAPWTGASSQTADGPAFPDRTPAYAYLVDGRQVASLPVYHHLLARGYRVGLLTRATRIAGMDVAGGTVVVKTGTNDADVGEAVRELAARFGVAVHGVDSGHSEPGYPTLGSAQVLVGRPAKIGLLAEGSVAGYSFGWAWYTLVEQHDVPVTVLRSSSLSGRDLAGFNVLIVPHLSSPAGLARGLGEEGLERLKIWIREGGTLVTIGSGTAFALLQLEAIALRDWYETEEGKDSYRFTVPGAIVAAELDTLSWLATGQANGSLPVLVGSSRVYLPPEGPVDSGRRVVGSYAPADRELRLSGHLWAENRERLPGSVFLYEEQLGAGRVIAFTEDPNFRAFWRGANRLFLNAVLVSPAAP